VLQLGNPVDVLFDVLPYNIECCQLLLGQVIAVCNGVENSQHGVTGADALFVG
jgi:hypothetical protein